MKKAHPEDYEDYGLLMQEDPDLVHPLFLLRNGWCNVYVDNREKPKTLLVMDKQIHIDLVANFQSDSMNLIGIIYKTLRYEYLSGRQSEIALPGKLSGPIA